MKRRILFLTIFSHRLHWGWIKFLNKNHELFLIMPKSKGFFENCLLKNNIISNIRQIFLLETVIHKIKNGFLAYYKDLRKVLQDLKPDIIFCEFVYQLYSITCAKFAKKYDTKLIFYDETLGLPTQYLIEQFFKYYINFLKQKFLKTLDFKIISPTLHSYKFWNNLGFKNVYYIPFSFWKEEYEKTDHPQDKIRGIYIGRLVNTKNIDLIIEATHLFLKKEKIEEDKIEISIIGNGPHKESLIKKTERLGLTNIIRFLGWIKNEDLKEYYKNSNIFILPSIKDPIGFVTLEAMYYGLPIIISIHAGSSSYIIPYYNGLIINPSDSKSLRLAFSYYKSKVKRKKHGENSYTLAKNLYNYKHIGSLLNRIIEK